MKKSLVFLLSFLLVFPAFAHWKDKKTIDFYGRTGFTKIYVTPLTIREDNIQPGWQKTYKIRVENVGSTPIRLTATLQQVPGFLQVRAWFARTRLIPRQTTTLYIRVLMPAGITNYQRVSFHFRCVVEAKQYWR